MACNLACALLLNNMHAMCPVPSIPWVDLQQLKDKALATHLSCGFEFDRQQSPTATAGLLLGNPATSGPHVPA